MNNPRNLALGAAGVAALLYFTPGNPFNTPAVKMVGEAHAKGGALPNHSPAIATGRGMSLLPSFPDVMLAKGTEN